MKLNNSYTAITRAFKEYLHTLGFAESTLYDYPRFIAYFLSHLEQNNIHNLQHLDGRHVMNYFKYLEQKTGERTRSTFSTAHLNRNFLAIDKFLAYLHQIGLDTVPLPTKYTIEHQPKKTLQVLTKKEIQDLYEAVEFTYANITTLALREPRQMAIKLVLDLCYGCGLRRSEALNVELKDINFDTKVLHVKQGKYNKDRYVPMSNKVAQSIQIFAYHYRRCFPPNKSQKLYPLKEDSIAKALKRLIKNCDNNTLKDKKPTLHTLRHSIATHLLKNGMSIENISRFLGHSSLTSTQIYTHIADEQL